MNYVMISASKEAFAHKCCDKCLKMLMDECCQQSARKRLCGFSASERMIARGAGSHRMGCRVDSWMWKQL